MGKEGLHRPAARHDHRGRVVDADYNIAGRATGLKSENGRERVWQHRLAVSSDNLPVLAEGSTAQKGVAVDAEQGERSRVDVLGVSFRIEEESPLGHVSK